VAVASVPSASPARVLRVPRRLDARKLFGLFLMLVATGGSLAFWTTSSATQSVLVATRDLSMGTRLSAADVAVARVHVDEAIYRALVPAAEQASIMGKLLSQPLSAHQPLARTHVSSRSALASDQLAMTIPIAAVHAAGGRIQPGDAVQVLATFARGRPESSTLVVLPRVLVHAVEYDERLAVMSASTSSATGTDSVGGRSASGRLTAVTLAVTQDQALRLAQAKWNGDLDVALLPPGAE
jgi:Flp pilus assembly protein CpaB